MIIREERIGGQRLILGDCLQVMPLLGRSDAVVTDPPYGISSHTPWRLRRLDYGEWDKETATPTAIAMLVMCASVPSVIAWCDWRQLSALANACPGRSERPLTWVKPNPPVLNGQRLFLSATEHAFYGKLPGAWFSGGCVKSWWIGPPPPDRKHPTQKPDWLMSQCVQAIVPSGGTCLDPFMGSGTTLVACQRLGRSGTGIEMDADYFDIACKRVDEATRQHDLFVAPPHPKPPSRSR